MKTFLLGTALFAAATIHLLSQDVKPGTHRPKLILAIIVDQFRYDYTTRFRAEYTGGIKTLLENGAVYVDAHQDHYPTVTAVGHATYLTGSVPATSGIVSNEWFDRASGKTVTSVEDAATQIVGLGGAKPGIGSSPHNLIVSTLGDELKMAGRAESKTIGISMKDRAAILPSGHMADAAYWFDSKSDQVVSSTYYMQQLPAWAKKFNDEHIPEKDAGRKWYATEGGKQGKLLATLPTQIDPNYFLRWEETPFANNTLEQFAELALNNEKLGQHPGTDLLTVSFSANDHLGHAVGPDDPAVKEMSIETDQTLGKLLKAAEQAAGGADNLLVVFSADHGVAPKPEVMAERRIPSGRIDRDKYVADVTAKLNERFGEGKWILYGGEAGFYLNYDLLSEKKLKLNDVEDAIAEIVRTMPFIAKAYTAHDLQEFSVGTSITDEYVSRGYYRDRCPDVFAISKPYYMFGKHGATHGTPYNYDTHVPLIFYGAGIKAGSYYERVGISDVAPTLAAITQVQPPSGSIGHVLPEVMHAAGVAGTSNTTATSSK